MTISRESWNKLTPDLVIWMFLVEFNLGVDWLSLTLRGWPTNTGCWSMWRLINTELIALCRFGDWRVSNSYCLSTVLHRIWNQTSTHKYLRRGSIISTGIICNLTIIPDRLRRCLKVLVWWRGNVMFLWLLVLCIISCRMTLSAVNIFIPLTSTWNNHKKSK